MRFQNKYRVQSSRMPGRDYARPGNYFVTICTKNRAHWFGEIRSGIIGLSDVGCIVADEIQKTSIIRPHVYIHEWIIMPDHLHIIFTIGIRQFPNADGLHPVMHRIETHRRCVSTKIVLLIGLPKRKSNTLGSIVAQIKSVCTKRIFTMGYSDFAWQPRFHDHIIRDQQSLHRIQQYIKNNPTQSFAKSLYLQSRAVFRTLSD